MARSGIVDHGFHISKEISIHTPTPNFYSRCLSSPYPLHPFTLQMYLHFPIPQSLLFRCQMPASSLIRCRWHHASHRAFQSRYASQPGTRWLHIFLPAFAYMSHDTSYSSLLSRRLPAIGIANGLAYTLHEIAYPRDTCCGIDIKITVCIPVGTLLYCDDQVHATSMLYDYISSSPPAMLLS